MNWRLWLSGAASAAVFAGVLGCATGHTSVDEGGGDGSESGVPPGAKTCKTDAECAPGVCKQVVVGGSGVCVSACKKQADCATNQFCEPKAPGAADGYCIPRSPAHCLACDKDSDCGAFSDVCVQVAGDSAAACHIDCSLSGNDACPDDYTCSDQMVNGKPRKLCRPKVAQCGDAVGGFCDVVKEPQPCKRTSADGACTGERTCDAETKRFGQCSAPTPKCKADCSAKEVPGCTTNVCGGGANAPNSCGMCGNVCPGYMKQAANATCEGGKTCGFSCQGENYDVDNDASNGCEVADVESGNHTHDTAAGGTPASVSCNDGDTIAITGELLSDTRAHEQPAVDGFDTSTGSAPDWYTVHMDGGLCVNQCVVSFTVNGTAFPDCYRIDLTFEGSNASYSCQTAGGKCTINQSSNGSYSDGDDLYIQVSKTCGADQVEDVTYNLTGHF
jgi:hypothetical protein